MSPSAPPPRAAAQRSTDPQTIGAAKDDLRRVVLARRRRRLAEPGSLETAGRSVRDVLLQAPEISALAPGALVAAYLELRSEVPTAAIRRSLQERGLGVLVPVLLPDHDLDWSPLGPARAEPVLLGPGAVTTVSAILLPGVAGDRSGNRLGRGGGSYDRALARLADAPAGRRPWTCLVLFADEVLDEVPVTDQDIAVDAIATPAGLVRTVRRAHRDSAQHD